MSSHDSGEVIVIDREQTGNVPIPDYINIPNFIPDYRKAEQRDEAIANLSIKSSKSDFLDAFTDCDRKELGERLIEIGLEIGFSKEEMDKFTRFWADSSDYSIKLSYHWSENEKERFNDITNTLRSFDREHNFQKNSGEITNAMIKLELLSAEDLAMLEESWYDWKKFKSLNRFYGNDTEIQLNAYKKAYEDILEYFTSVAASNLAKRIPTDVQQRLIKGGWDLNELTTQINRFETELTHLVVYDLRKLDLGIISIDPFSGEYVHINNHGLETESNPLIRNTVTFLNGHTISVYSNPVQATESTVNVNDLINVVEQYELGLRQRHLDAHSNQTRYLFTKHPFDNQMLVLYINTEGKFRNTVIPPFNRIAQVGSYEVGILDRDSINSLKSVLNDLSINYNQDIIINYREELVAQIAQGLSLQNGLDINESLRISNLAIELYLRNKVEL